MSNWATILCRREDGPGYLAIPDPEMKRDHQGCKFSSSVVGDNACVMSVCKVEDTTMMTQKLSRIGKVKN
jgi:hypothetical protein